MKKRLSFEEGLKYPWRSSNSLWNILWIFIPILGWLALIGYFQMIVQSLANGNFKGLPKFGKFWDLCGDGLLLFVQILVIMIIVSVIEIVPVIGWISGLVIRLFILPYLIINFLVTNRFSALFEIEKTVKIISKNIKEYVIALLKQIAYSVIYIFASIILVGIPCLVFGQNIYLVDFYNKYKK